MKKLYTILTGFFCIPVLAIAQHLTPSDGIKVAYVSPEQGSIQTCDVGLQYAYYNDGDFVYRVSLISQEVIEAWPKPADYDLVTYPSFMTLAPDLGSLWVGYTDLNNEDARIYELDLQTGNWKLAANFPGNYDLEFWGDSILVSGLNSAGYDTPNGIWVLDTTGANGHRKIIETGGTSAGLAVDASGNLYYGTSDLMNPNALYRWSVAQMEGLVNVPDAAFLGPAGGEKLADLPNGASDCEVDQGQHLVFTMNAWGGTQVLGTWNGTPGDGNNYDTLAISDSWLSMVKSRGDYTVQTIGNSLLVTSYDMPVADVHTVDYPASLAGSLPVIQGTAGEKLAFVLDTLVEDLDDPETVFEVSMMTVPGVATTEVDGDTLFVTLGDAGQSGLQLTVTSGSQTFELSTLVAAWPLLEGDFLLSDFNDLVLDAESSWNGSDGSGGFNSGIVHYKNDYNAEWATWNGWSYSNVTDAGTSGMANQYSAITEGGFSGAETDGTNYGVSYVFGQSSVDLPSKAHAIRGIFVTNATYTVRSMELGDSFSKKFGGESGSDPDYFLLKAWGNKGGVNTDTMDFYLADYRFDEDLMDYIVKTWQWFDLGQLGKVDSLFFALESSDTGDWGMNTPAYFCMDAVHIIPDQAPYVANPIPDQTSPASPGQLVIDVSGVFTDPDDDDADIVLSLPEEINGPLGAELQGTDLVLTNFQLLKSTFVPVEVILEGSLGGLSARDTFMVDVELIGSVIDEHFPGLQVYPNPTSGSLRIDATGMGESELRIYSLTGTILYENTRYMAGDEIDIRHLAPGAYILRVQNRQHSGSMLIQKQ